LAGGEGKGEWELIVVLPFPRFLLLVLLCVFALMSFCCLVLLFVFALMSFLLLGVALFSVSFALYVLYSLFRAAFF
jgi:hypothetical protein